MEYCEQIGAESRLDGAVILNRTRDAADPNFRERRILPYLTGDSRTTILGQAGQDGTAAGASVQIPVTAYTLETPVLREEYGTLDFYELVHFIPVSLWHEIKGQIGGAEEDIYIRILGEDGVTEDRLHEIEEAVSEILGRMCEAETENRLQAVRDNDKMFDGMKAVLSVFCILLATIGYRQCVFQHDWLCAAEKEGVCQVSFRRHDARRTAEDVLHRGVCAGLPSDVVGCSCRGFCGGSDVKGKLCGSGGVSG